VWTDSTLSLSSFPSQVLPVLFVRKRLCILCVPPKFHNLPPRGNIILHHCDTLTHGVAQACCSVLQCIAVCVAGRFSTLQCAAVHCLASAWHVAVVGYLSLCSASRMWVRHQSVVIVAPEGGMEFSSGLTKKIVFLFMSRLTNSSGLPYKIVIES